MRSCGSHRQGGRDEALVVAGVLAHPVEIAQVQFRLTQVLGHLARQVDRKARDLASQKKRLAHQVLEVPVVEHQRSALIVKFIVGQVEAGNEGRLLHRRHQRLDGEFVRDPGLGEKTPQHRVVELIAHPCGRCAGQAEPLRAEVDAQALRLLARDAQTPLPLGGALEQLALALKIEGEVELVALTLQAVLHPLAVADVHRLDEVDALPAAQELLQAAERPDGHAAAAHQQQVVGLELLV